MSKIEAFKMFMSALRGKAEVTPELLAACDDESKETQSELIKRTVWLGILNRIIFGVIAALFILFGMPW